MIRVKTAPEMNAIATGDLNSQEVLNRLNINAIEKFNPDDPDLPKNVRERLDEVRKNGGKIEAFYDKITNKIFINENVEDDKTRALVAREWKISEDLKLGKGKENDQGKLKSTVAGELAYDDMMKRAGENKTGNISMDELKIGSMNVDSEVTADFNNKHVDKFFKGLNEAGNKFKKLNIIGGFKQLGKVGNDTARVLKRDAETIKKGGPAGQKTIKESIGATGYAVSKIVPKAKKTTAGKKTTNKAHDNSSSDKPWAFGKQIRSRKNNNNKQPQKTTNTGKRNNSNSPKTTNAGKGNSSNSPKTTKKENKTSNQPNEPKTAKNNRIFKQEKPENLSELEEFMQSKGRVPNGTKYILEFEDGRKVTINSQEEFKHGTPEELDLEKKYANLIDANFKAQDVANKNKNFSELRKLQEESTILHKEQRNIYGYRSSPFGQIGETGDMLASIKGYKNGVIILDGDKYKRETGSDWIAAGMDIARAYHSIESGLVSPKGFNTKPINPANSTSLEDPAKPISPKNIYRIGNNISKETKTLFINDGTPGGTSTIEQTIQSDIRGTLINERNLMTGEMSTRAMYPNGELFYESRFIPTGTIKQIGSGSTPLIETPRYPISVYQPPVTDLSTVNYFSVPKLYEYTAPVSDTTKSLFKGVTDYTSETLEVPENYYNIRAKSGHLNLESQRIVTRTYGNIINPEYISTADPLKEQYTLPKNLNEQIFYESVKANPLQGKPLINMNNDPNFSKTLGYQKMQAVYRLSNGEKITIHYQYNKITKKVYDIKFTR